MSSTKYELCSSALIIILITCSVSLTHAHPKTKNDQRESGKISSFRRYSSSLKSRIPDINEMSKRTISHEKSKSSGEEEQELENNVKQGIGICFANIDYARMKCVHPMKQTIYIPQDYSLQTTSSNGKSSSSSSENQYEPHNPNLYAIYNETISSQNHKSKTLDKNFRPLEVTIKTTFADCCCTLRNDKIGAGWVAPHHKYCKKCPFIGLGPEDDYGFSKEFASLCPNFEFPDFEDYDLDGLEENYSQVYEG